MELVAGRRIGRAFLVPLVALALLFGFVLYNQLGSGTPWRATGAPVPAHTPAVKKLTLADMLLAATTATRGITLEFDGVTAAPAATHTGHMSLTSFQWGVGVAAPVGGSGTGKPSFSDITVTKSTDKYSLPLLGKTFRSLTTPGAVLYFTDVNSGGTAFDYLEIDLRNVVVTGMSMSSGGETPSESISMNYNIITFKAHIPGAVAQTVTYNLDTNTAS